MKIFRCVSSGFGYNLLKLTEFENCYENTDKFPYTVEELAKYLLDIVMEI